MYVIFNTPTLLDMRAITMFGMNSKPNTTNPIGYFGTGLKMAIATLVRNKIRVRIFVGHKEWEFGVKDIDFRDKEFQQIIARRRDSAFMAWRTIELPFTTELAKNWELWMAFRELESNTRDENGITFAQTHDDWDTMLSDHTTIVVGPSQKFAEVYENIDTIFLPEGSSEISHTEQLQILDAPSHYLYYRGMRVHKLSLPSVLTYNWRSPLSLTEDRTLKDEWSIPYWLVNHLVNLGDEALIEKIMHSTTDNWESTLPWDFAAPPSNTFAAFIKKLKEAETLPTENVKPERRVFTSPRMSSYYTKYVEPPDPTTFLSHIFNSWWESHKQKIASLDLDLSEDNELIERVHQFIKVNE